MVSVKSREKNCTDSFVHIVIYECIILFEKYYDTVHYIVA